MGYSREHPTALFDKEGFILLSDDGQWWTNQTGGVSCNHPVAQGEFQYHPIPRNIQRELVDRCYLDAGDISKLNYLFAQAGIPFVAESGEEAWVHGSLNGKPAIATWENSD